MDMISPEYLRPYQFNWKTHAFLSLVMLLSIVLFREQGLVLQMTRPALAAMAMLIFFQLLSYWGFFLAERIQKRLQIAFPSLMLWLYPTLVLLHLAFFSFILVISSNFFWGRGFWSGALKLNGLETTRFFSTCFATMIIFTAMHFIFATIGVLKWITGSSLARVEALQNPCQDNSEGIRHISQTIKIIRSETDMIQIQRVRANRVNRIALVLLFSFLLGGGCWIVFFRPAVVLYYRAEIQLRSFIEPMAAFATLEHLCEKYPDYHYMDSVKYRMAWILDRRMNKHQEAATSYLEFIEKYAPKSTWSDEAYVALVRLYLDKIKNPKQALYYSSEYLRHFPQGIFAPHMHLYRIRALFQTGQNDEAQAEIDASLADFSGRMMQIISHEDRLLELVSFEDAIKAEINANANPR